MIFLRSLAKVIPPKQDHKTLIGPGDYLFQDKAALCDFIQNPDKGFRVFALVIVKNPVEAASAAYARPGGTP